MLRFILLLASGSLAFAQQYTISTIAGGSPPATPTAASSTSIGQPRRVALDAAGNVYFSSANSVFKLTGSVLTLVAGNSRAGFSGDGGSAVNAQLNTPQGLAVDAAGNVYIADSGNNRIRMVSAAGIISTFAGNGNSSLGGGPRTYNDGGAATDALMKLPMAVAVDKSGNVYIADTGDNSIRKVTTDGIINTIVGDSYPGFFGDEAAAVDAELHSPSDVAIDSSGKIYIADTANAVIRQVTTDGIIHTFAGSTAIGFSGDAGPALKAALLAPLSVAVDASGNVYIVENGDSRIRKVDTKLNINTIVGTGTAGFAGDGSDATKAQTNSPTGIAVDSSGNLYIADFLNLRVRKVASGSISSIAGNGLLSYSGDGGPALKAQMNAPQGIVADGVANLYISDTGNNVVRKVSRTGNSISTVAGNGAAGSNGDGSAATSAQLNSPAGLAWDSSNNLYIADSQNAKIRKVSTTGTISTLAGNGTPGFGGDGSAATGAQLNTPLGVALDASGNLFIADFGNNRIRRVSASGTITTVAGNGGQGYAGDGGPATNAQLNTPTAVALDGAGNLYIADAGNAVIRMVNASGVISTIAGNGTAGYSGDGGPATKAQLANPRAIAVDPVGNVYIADGSTLVRQIIYPTGIITTIAGNGSRGYSGDGGLGRSAQINGPTSLALDLRGDLYIADTGNDAVRVLRYVGSAISVGSVVNGASNAAVPVAPGEVVVIYGSGLGPATLTQFQLGNDGRVPTNVAGTSVLVNGVPAPILYTSATQVAAVFPFEVTGVNATLVVVYQGQAAAAVSVSVAPSFPGVFTANASGTGPAAALNIQKGVATVNDAAHPANTGDVVTVYITGGGQTNPASINGKPGGDGTAGNPFLLPLLPVTVTVGGKNATVQFAGSAPNVVAGIMQVNLVVPAGLTAGAVPVVVQVGATTSQTGVTIAVSGN